MARKTIEVKVVLERANTFLAAADSFTKEGIDPASQRFGLIALLENILFGTGNYEGFRYQQSELKEDGTLRDGHDDSRRWYYGEQ